MPSVSGSTQSYGSNWSLLNKIHDIKCLVLLHLSMLSRTNALRLAIASLIIIPGFFLWAGADLVFTVGVAGIVALAYFQVLFYKQKVVMWAFPALIISLTVYGAFLETLEIRLIWQLVVFFQVLTQAAAYLGRGILSMRGLFTLIFQLSLIAVMLVFGHYQGPISVNIDEAFWRWTPIVTLAPAVYQIRYSLLVGVRRLQKGKKDEMALNWLNILINLISHNIRTPLSTVKTNIELVKLQTDQGLSPSPKQLQRMDDAVDVVRDTMNRLLRAASIRQHDGGITAEALKSALEKAYPDAHFSVADSVRTWNQGELVALQLAMEVFIDNAFLHGKPPVEVSVNSHELIIRDHGGGLTAEQIAEFSNRKERDGAEVHGIGVSFAYQLLDAVGWYIEPQNVKGGFQVRIERVERKKQA